MAEVKNAPYTVKHVDGVMHLSMTPDRDARVNLAQVRVLPPMIEADDE